MTTLPPLLTLDEEAIEARLRALRRSGDAMPFDPGPGTLALLRQIYGAHSDARMRDAWCLLHRLIPGPSYRAIMCFLHGVKRK